MRSIFSQGFKLVESQTDLKGLIADQDSEQLRAETKKSRLNADIQVAESKVGPAMAVTSM